MENVWGAGSGVGFGATSGIRILPRWFSARTPRTSAASFCGGWLCVNGRPRTTSDVDLEQPFVETGRWRSEIEDDNPSVQRGHAVTEIIGGIIILGATAACLGVR